MTFKIDGSFICPEEPPYIVAEIGASHNGSKEVAMKLMLDAFNAGADAVKFQCYTQDTITINSHNEDFIVKDGPWAGKRLYELYAIAHTPWDWFPDIFQAAKVTRGTVFASVFDQSSVDFLEKFDCPAYKIASMEIVDTPLIRYAAGTGKPILISTGMASREEILEAEEAAGYNSMLLHCVSGYPTNVVNMGLVPANEFTGISDHSLGADVPIAAVALGYSLIEKHIKCEGDTYGLDSKFAMTPSEFQDMSRRVRNIWAAMHSSAGRQAAEKSSRQMRRSLYVVKDTKKGEIFTQDNVRSIRPGYGLPPKAISNVLGKKATMNLLAGTALTWEMING